MAAASAVAVAASMAKAASAPLVVVVESMPSGGALQYTQVIGTLIIAAIAAGITWAMQRRQVTVANGALETARSKLRLDLFDKRYAMFLAGKELITDHYMIVMDNESTSKMSRLIELSNATTGASWLLDDKVEAFLKTMADEAMERYLSYREREKQRKVSAADLGFDSKALQEGQLRMTEQQQTLVDLFRPFMRIRVKPGLED